MKRIKLAIRPLFLCLCLPSSLLLSLTLAAGQPGMRPFPVDWCGGSRGPASVAFLLEAPAGKEGFILARTGHLIERNGEGFRIWGANLISSSLGEASLTRPHPRIVVCYAGMISRKEHINA